MFGREEGVINIEDVRHAVSRRLLPGAQIAMIGSPWSPASPVAKWYTDGFGRMGGDMLVIRAPSYHMNPVVWNEQVVAEAKASDPDVYRTDVEALFASPGETLFPVELVTKNVGQYERAEPDPACQYVAAMDPATRANGWTLVVATRDATRRKVVMTKEWRGSYDSPLNPKVVMAEIAEELNHYGIRAVLTDQYAADALISIGRDVGLQVEYKRMGHQDIVKAYMGLRNLLDSGSVLLPNNRQLINDLLMITKKPTANGVAIHLPSTQDGRHCDYAPALMLALSETPTPRKPKLGEVDAERERLLKAAMNKYGSKSRTW